MYLVYPAEDEYHLQRTCSKSGAVVRALTSHQFGRGSNPGVNAICGLSLLLALSFAPRGFSQGTPVFPSPQKPTLPNSNSTGNARTRLNEFSRTLKYFLAKRITVTFFLYQIYLGERGDGLARLPPSTAINPRAHPSVLLIQRWPPLTESARSRRSYGKIKDCEQSKLVKSIAGRFVQCLDNVR